MEASRRGGRVDGAHRADPAPALPHPVPADDLRHAAARRLRADAAVVARPAGRGAPDLAIWLSRAVDARRRAVLSSAATLRVDQPAGQPDARICARHRGARGGLVRDADGECRHGVPAGGRSLRARPAGRHLCGAVRSGGAALRVAVRRRSAGDLRRRAGAVFRRARVRFRRDPGRVGAGQREDRDPVRGLADDPLRAAHG